MPDTKPTAGFKAIMREAITTRSYAAALSVLNFDVMRLRHRNSPSGLEDTQRQAGCERRTQLFTAAEILR
jgi:hypothetical protein